jgi:hypothetical protein
MTGDAVGESSSGFGASVLFSLAISVRPSFVMEAYAPGTLRTPTQERGDATDHGGSKAVPVKDAVLPQGGTPIMAWPSAGIAFD